MIGTHEILVGDVADVLPTLASGAFDAVCCDPPYGLGLMGKGWDRGVPPKEVWSEVLRVLRPGAHVIAFGGTRTYHRLACAVEDAGFAIRDCLSWIYGSGFPKSLDISKAIDGLAGAERAVVGRRRFAVSQSPIFRDDGWAPDIESLSQVTAPATDAAIRFEGYGTALKPAWEPALLAMKPLDGTFAANALENGIAGLNVNSGRVALGEEEDPAALRARSGGAGDRFGGSCYSEGLPNRGDGWDIRPGGRWPANVLFDEEAAAALDDQSGELNSGALTAAQQRRGGFAGSVNAYGTAARGGTGIYQANRGGASRFFYTAKASGAERNAGLPEGVACAHPTLKPVRLIEYMAGLLLPPERADGHPRRILVPFAGAGSEVAGCLRAGWDEVVGIEMSAEYAEWARYRVPALARMRFDETKPKAPEDLPGQTLMFEEAGE